MIDYSKNKTRKAEQEASSMIENIRVIGYNFENALADIIDISLCGNCEFRCN